MIVSRKSMDKYNEVVQNLDNFPFSHNERQVIETFKTLKMKDVTDEHWKAIDTLHWRLEQMRTGNHKEIIEKLHQARRAYET